MNKSAFTLVVGLCLVGLTAWAGPSLWRAHHEGSSCGGCCGMVAITEEQECSAPSCCEATAATCEVKAGTCCEGSMVCTEGVLAIGFSESCCESAMPTTEPGERFVNKMTIKVHPPRE